MTGYYDVVLALIPVALLGITAALTVVGLTLTTAVPLAAVVASAVIGHAMFVNAPIERQDEVQSATQRRKSKRPPVNPE